MSTPSAREHLNTIIDLASELAKRTDSDLEHVYDTLQEADDALTETLNLLTGVRELWLVEWTKKTTGGHTVTDHDSAARVIEAWKASNVENIVGPRRVRLCDERDPDMHVYDNDYGYVALVTS